MMSGRDNSTPARAFGGVTLVIGVVFVIVCAAALGLWLGLR
jgi:hypothetical protein